MILMEKIHMITQGIMTPSLVMKILWILMIMSMVEIVVNLVIYGFMPISAIIGLLLMMILVEKIHIMYQGIMFPSQGMEILWILLLLPTMEM